MSMLQNYVHKTQSSSIVAYGITILYLLSNLYW